MPCVTLGRGERRCIGPRTMPSQWPADTETLKPLVLLVDDNAAACEGIGLGAIAANHDGLDERR